MARWLSAYMSSIALAIWQRLQLLVLITSYWCVYGDPLADVTSQQNFIAVGSEVLFLCWAIIHHCPLTWPVPVNTVLALPCSL